MLSSQTTPPTKEGPTEECSVGPERGHSGRSDRIRLLLLAVNVAAILVMWGLSIPSWATCLVGVFLAALLHEVTFRFSRKWVVAGIQTFYAGIGTTLAVRFLASVILVAGYLVSSLAHKWEFALSYGLAYVVIGFLEASALVKAERSFRRDDSMTKSRA